MAKAIVRYTEQARQDLAEIFQQRLAQRGAEGWDGARAYVAGIVATIDGIAAFPERGPIPPELDALGEKSWRQISHPPYRVIYLLEEGAATVVVVADSRRDFDGLLQRRLLGG